ncbi:MAG: high-affinity branched-chain amino acid ABC transporter permease LivM [Desulfuromonadales bacterium]|nr:high-affinity branched-chain amino acid ABC transporter permease LivM [Desulfuromonadales bacterium]
MLNHCRQSLLVAAWFVFLTFPLLVVKVNTLKGVVEWRWANILWVAVAVFPLSLGWRWAMARRQGRRAGTEAGRGIAGLAGRWQLLLAEPARYRPLLAVLLLGALAMPLLTDIYQTNILVLALIFVVLGLGLNITVGLAGLLDLGYIAFFAVGAYTYGVLNSLYGLGFWICLPLGGLAGALCGVALGLPILRLRGDYLAIVTLGFGLIVKVVIENGEELFHGARGIANIPRPGLFGLDMSIEAATIYTYYLMLLLVLLTVFVTNRLKDSRIGRAWMALREDEIACVAMGIDMARTKMSAYALGACWAGLVGVIFAARNTYIHPNSFTFMESALVLSIVVLGGMGSIVGVIIAALILVLLPEYLRAFAEYRMLLFGAVMVLMMIFRPQGLFANQRRSYRRHGATRENSHV